MPSAFLSSHTHLPNAVVIVGCEAEELAPCSTAEFELFRWSFNELVELYNLKVLPHSGHLASLSAFIDLKWSHTVLRYDCFVCARSRTFTVYRYIRCGLEWHWCPDLVGRLHCISQKKKKS